MDPDIREMEKKEMNEGLIISLVTLQNFFQVLGCICDVEDTN